LQSTEIDLDGFKVTLVVGGSDTVLTPTNSDELSMILSHSHSAYSGGAIIHLALIPSLPYDLKMAHVPKHVVIDRKAYLALK
jgi:hypothetical protein